ncbi:transporter substrate-binding domain-containing protein [Marinobacter sp. CHS3-4]|uniref:substrate-binding periplasmic protein n=1 Tax=Marinobacter sp. CHS3-4 TaxID=3045174 RepID=UPI0024B522C0|nr:transporter substrate-binding domain-containing protein [Marinobacter sp. CHS3-4]MDI9246929.1 transporter substrate-binding domain-containing protein [Marinobacter sp. CHS3-4]
MSAEPVSDEQLHPIEGVPLKLRTLENPPLAYTDKDGQIVGVLVEGIREAVRRTGHEVEFRIYPWKRVLREVSTGNADAAFNAGKNAERQAWGRYHESVLIDETYVFFAAEPMALSPELEEAPDLRVGIQLGYYYGERFDKMLENPPFLSMEVSQTIPRNLKLLRAGRIHVFIGDLLPTMHYIKDMGLEDEIKIVRNKNTGQPLVVSTSPTYVAFSRKRVDPAYVKTFNDALVSIKSDETFDRILQKYQLDIPDLPSGQ